MKQILASLLVAYTLTNGQTPPATTSAGGSAATTAGGSATTAGASAATTAAPVIIPPEIVPPVIVPPVIEPPPPPVPVVNPSQTTTAPQPVIVVSPVSPAPTTPSPTTAAPTTAAPTYNPYCPMPAELNSQHGVQSGILMSSNQGCISPFERATAFNGILQCSTYACCQCAEIQCGDPFGLACDELVISDSGAVGNQNINVLGDMSAAFGGNSFAGIGGAMNNGAQIGCNGLEACKASKINGKYVGQVKCAGDMGCAGANIRLEDPGTELQVQCNGMMSCMNANLEIIITPNSQVFELGTIEFNGQQAAQGMTITIENQGFYPVMLQNLECMNPTACPNLRINIIGQVFIENCDLQHMNVQTAGPSLLAACQAGNAFQGGGGFIPQFPPQVPPQVPPQAPPTNPGPVNPAPVNPTPVNPTPVNPTPVNPTPVNPTPVNPTPGLYPFMPVDPNQLTCEFGQCRGRAVTLTPAQHFQLDCGLPGQCDGMTLTLNVGGGGGFGGFGFVTEITSLKFSVPTRGVTININGYAEINDIRCEVAGACNGLKVNGANIDVYQLNMDCQQFGSCNGCTVNGIDCNMLSMTQGNNAGYAYGYQPGYNPYAPQQPQPQQPYNPYGPYNPWMI